MSKNRDKKHSAHKAAEAAHAQEVIEASAEHHEQHLVEAPKGTSRARFLFNFLLVVFLLLIFSITGPMMTTLGGNQNPNADKAYLSWKTSDGQLHSYTYEQFIGEKRSIASLDQIQQYLFIGQGDPKEDIHTARFLVLEDLAMKSGFHVTDTEVADAIKLYFGSVANYNNYIQSSRGLSTKAFETVLRRGLAIRRYVSTEFAIASEVLTEDVIDLWLVQAKEFNFEFATAQAADFEEAARAELPDDEALEDYFTALPPMEKSRFNTERSLSANLAYYDPAAEADYSKLLERFPAAGEETPEQVGERYYNSFSHIRFLNTSSQVDEEGNEANPEDRFQSFEEAKEQAMREAPVYYAMIEWLKELELRNAAGEELSLELEAGFVGLSSASVEPRTRTNWVDSEEPWAGRYLWSALTAAKDMQFAPRVAVEEGALVVARVMEVLPPELPPFAEIRDKVADKWVTDRAPVLATEKLETVRDSFGIRPEDGAMFETTATSEEFRAAAEAAGFTVEERGWGRQNPLPSSNLTGEAEFYIRAKSILFEQAEGTVLAAEADRSKKVVYLVRCMGERAGDPATMTPAEADQFSRQAKSSASNDAYTKTFGSDDWFRQKFQLKMVNEEEENVEG